MQRKVSFALHNIQNHFDGFGGPDHITIAPVVHRQALRSFHATSANPGCHRRVAQFSKAGVDGVVRIAELQSQGYLYLRP